MIMGVSDNKYFRSVSMYIRNFDILRGMDRHFVKEFMEIPRKEIHDEGSFLFHEGEKAVNFYILIRGRVKLSIGDKGHVVHIVDHPGEAFGWSSLLEKRNYSASSECWMPTKVLVFDGDKLRNVFDKYPQCGLVFYKRLSDILGNRLLQNYKLMSTGYQTQLPESFGSRQVHESTPAL
jgi:CRP-like cAMP-binding protein